MSVPADRVASQEGASQGGMVPREPARERAGRYAHRTRLYLWAALLIAALVFVVVLTAENTRSVKVGWVFGYSRISLVFLILFATILGWILGIATAILLRRRTRRQL